MTADDVTAERFQGLVAEIAGDIASTYRISSEKAAEWVGPVLSGNNDLRDILSRETDPKRIRRMRVYKDAVAAARRAVYFGLRRYRQDEETLLAAIERLETLDPQSGADEEVPAIDAILRSHVSTAERIEHADAVARAVVDWIGPAERVIDVGAGVFPLLVPFDQLTAVRTYLALDRDDMAMRALRAYEARRGDGRLVARTWNVDEGWSCIRDVVESEPFDVALMLKFIPAVQRRSPELLETLAQVPARRLVVTGSREAMVKRRAIAHREAGVLTSFAERFGFAIADRFETEDEIGFVLSRDT